MRAEHHSSRCETATSPRETCKCSCGGEMHGVRSGKCVEKSNGGGMLLCEREFEQPDPTDPDYSLVEIDYCTVHNTRVSLRKNLKRGLYEVYRRDYLQHTETVVYSHPMLEEAVRYAKQLTKYLTGYMPRDRVCKKYPHDCEGCGEKSLLSSLER